jgi:hypothetical protein
LPNETCTALNINSLLPTERDSFYFACCGNSQFFLYFRLYTLQGFLPIPVEYLDHNFRPFNGGRATDGSQFVAKQLSPGTFKASKNPLVMLGHVPIQREENAKQLLQVTAADKERGVPKK